MKVAISFYITNNDVLAPGHYAVDLNGKLLYSEDSFDWDEVFDEEDVKEVVKVFREVDWEGTCEVIIDNLKNKY